VVPSEAEADLALDVEVQGFVFSETDPVDMLAGPAMIAMDAATIDHFAAADALFTLRDVRQPKVLWRQKLHGSVTDHTMTVGESKKKVSDKLGQMLMREAFGRKKP
jgi:hypothetical protein